VRTSSCSSRRLPSPSSHPSAPPSSSTRGATAVCEGIEAEEHLPHHKMLEQHLLRLIGPKQQENRGWKAVGLGDHPEVVINGMELAPGRRGGDRAAPVVSRRGRGVDAAMLKGVMV
jgi:hypothetical protein